MFHATILQNWSPKWGNKLVQDGLREFLCFLEPFIAVVSVDVAVVCGCCCRCCWWSKDCKSLWTIIPRPPKKNIANIAIETWLLQFEFAGQYSVAVEDATVFNDYVIESHPPWEPKHQHPQTSTHAVAMSSKKAWNLEMCSEVIPSGARHLLLFGCIFGCRYRKIPRDSMELWSIYLQNWVV